MANEQTKAVIELVLQRIKTLESYDTETGKTYPKWRDNALKLEKELKDLKGWLINQKLDELDCKTMLDVAQ